MHAYIVQVLNAILKNACSYIIEAILWILRYCIILGHYVCCYIYVMSVATYVYTYDDYTCVHM